MSTESLKKTIAEVFTAAMSDGDYSRLNEIFSQDAISSDRVKSPNTSGPAGVKELVENLRRGFPDMKTKIHYQMTDEDKVATCWSMTGTHSGTFMGIPPTGRSVSTSAMSVDRVSNGKVVEYTTFRDDLGLMEQINQN